MGTVSDKRRKYLENLDEKPQRQALLWMMQHREPGHQKPGSVRPSQVDFDHLAERLSPEGRERLEAVGAGPERGKLIHRWVQIAQLHQIETVGLVGTLPQITLRELQRFSSQELTDAQRDVVDRMPRTRKLREMLGLYFLSVDRLAETTPEEIKAGFPLRALHRPGDGPRHDGPQP
jgi:hypothetical protein